MNEFINYIPIFDQNPQRILDWIIEEAKKYLPKNQTSRIQKAYNYAYQAHNNDKRLSGEYYIIHPLKATEILMDIKPDVESIQACLLHDVVEDTHITHEQIEKEFGTEISFLCKGLEKVSKIKYRGEERQLETLKKTFIAMAQDLRVIFIKIADRIHNIQTLHYHPKPEKRIKIANETMKIYVPIARKLGLYNYQLYLENGSFRVLNEPDFNKIFNYLKKSFGADHKYKDKGAKIVSEFLKKENIKNFSIEGRLKSPRRIYQKMKNKYQSRDISNVMDLLAYRIIAETVADCYMIFGVIHKYYTPLIKKIKDYIAIPKFNGYKSIHTTVLGIFHFPTEIQIRTHEMDEIAKFGVAAHFEYTEKGKSAIAKTSQGKRIKKIQELVERYQVLDEKDDFKDKLNIEVLERSVFLYTPQGDVIELPHGSSVLDFAFRVHSNIGLSFKSAIVNGSIKPISYIPQTGDITEIKTYKNKYTASRHRKEFLHTPSAKGQLNKYLRTQKKEELIKQSIIQLNQKLKDFGLPTFNSDQDQIQKKYSETKLEKKFLNILDRKENYSQLIKSVYPQERKKYQDQRSAKRTSPKKINKDVLVDCNKMINYTLCLECKPKPSDSIIARTGKDGIKIHTLNCKALKTVSPSKLLEAHREGKSEQEYKMKIEMEAANKDGNIIKIMTLFSELNITITQISIQNLNSGKSKISLEIEFVNPTKIAYLLNDLKKYKNSIKIIKKRFII